jgi:hypothetical protein
MQDHALIHASAAVVDALQLMLRRFSPAGSNKGPKKLPKVWCPRGTPQSALMPTFLMKMRQPLNTYDDY